MLDHDLICADPSDTRKALHLPLTGAWFCKNFSPYLMPPLYALSLAACLTARFPARLLSRPKAGVDEAYLGDLLTRYPSSLYPILTLLLQTQAFAAAVDGGGVGLHVGLEGVGWSPTALTALTALTATPAEATALPIDAGSVDVYRLNNVIHQTERRDDVLREAARVVRPGGTLLLTDNTVEWVEATWTVRLARAIGRPALAQRLRQDKLQSSHQKLAPDASWWSSHLDDAWELVALRPFFSKDSMTVASLFESLNFKQGGPGHEWLAGRIARNPILRRVYRWLLAPLARTLARLEPELLARSGATNLLVVLRRRHDR